MARWAPIAAILSMALAGCALPAERGAIETAAVEASQRMTERRSKLVTTHALPTDRTERPFKYHLYTPPSYALSDRRFPVIYWLHGSGGFPPGMVAMLAARFHAAMEGGRIPEALVVFPDGFAHTLWVNAKDGSMPVEDVFVGDLVPLVDARYRTVASRDGRVLEGASMGGYGALRLALAHPHLFGAVSAFNPGPMARILNPDNAPLAGRERAQKTLDTVYGGDPAHFETLSPWTLAEAFAGPAAPSLAIRLVLGEDDPTTATNLHFAEHLRRLGLDREVLVLQKAGHDPKAMFNALDDDYWTFFDRALARAGQERAGMP